MTPDQLAINTVSLRHDDFTVMLDACASAGFRKVEFALPQAKKWMAATNAGPAQLKALLDERGLTCIGGFEAAARCFGDVQQMADNLALLTANGQLIDALGGGTIVVGSDGPEAGASIDAARTIGQRLAVIADALPPSVSLALEFNWSPVIRSLRSADLAVEEANHPRVGILFDPAHYHCTASKLADLTPQTVARILHVHVDDMANKPGDLSHCNSDRRLPGEGCLNLGEILGRIEGLGYTGNFAIEMFSDELWAMPVAEAAKKMYRSMVSLCG